MKPAKRNATCLPTNFALFLTFIINIKRREKERERDTRGRVTAVRRLAAAETAVCHSPRSIFQQAGRLHSTYEWPLVHPPCRGRSSDMNIVAIIKTAGCAFQPSSSRAREDIVPL